MKDLVDVPKRVDAVYEFLDQYEINILERYDIAVGILDLMHQFHNQKLEASQNAVK